MTDESRLRIVVDNTQATDRVDKLDKSLHRLEKTGNRTDKQFNKLSKGSKGLSKNIVDTDSKFKSLVATALSFVGIGLAVSIFNTVKSFQSMKASLKSLLGDMESANGAFDALQTFASKTPYNLEQSVTAFQKLTALGLDPSEKALYSFGNTATAMGKDLNQMIEAVADAATGEFERLKEFGIKAKQSQDTVAFTFQGTTTVVKKNADEIQKYLIGIGETQFATAMKDQMNSLNGQLSNLQDEWAKLKYAIGQGLERSTFLVDIANALKALRTRIPVMQATFKSFQQFLFLQFDKVVAGFQKMGLYMEFAWVATIGAFKLLWAKAQDYIIGGYASVVNKLADLASVFPDSFGVSDSLREAAKHADTLASTGDTIKANLRDQTDSINKQIAEIDKGIALREQTSLQMEREYQAQIEIAKAQKGTTKSLDDYVKKTSEAEKASKAAAEAAKKASEERKKNYDKELESLKEWVSGKQEEVDLFGKTSAEVDRYNLSVAAGTAAVQAQTEAERERVRVLTEQGLALIDIIEQQEKDKAYKERAKELISEVDGGQQKYNEALTEYNDLRAKGYITDTQYLSLVEKLKTENVRLLDSTEQFNKGIKDAMSDYKKSAFDTYGQTKDIFGKTVDGMADALSDFVTTGKADFSELARSIIADLTAIYAKRALISFLDGNFGPPVGSTGGGFLSSTGPSGGGGFLSSIGSFIGGLFAEKGKAFSAAMLPQPIPAFGLGGSFTNSVVDSPTLFKFAGGTGVMGEKGPEAIMPLTRDSSGRLGVKASDTSTGSRQVVQQNTIIIQAPDGKVSKESLSQLQSKLGGAVQRSMRRNG